MPRLSADLVLRAPSRINPLNERELDLRGNKIPAIENLGACQDQYDTIDFSDNEVGKLENFPLLNRLRSITFNNNHITKIAPNLSESLPKLETLILTNNRIVNLADLDPLADLSTLRTLSVLDNVVSKKPNYRYYVINKLPDLKVLDFRKIKRKEREEAAKLFGAPVRKAKPTKGKKPAAQAKTFVPGESAVVAPSSVPAAKPAVDSQLALKAAVENARTLEEVERIERAMTTGGVVPAHTGDAEMKEAEAST
jgi:U2 small nuclear ribonucleoprotein A'